MPIDSYEIADSENQVSTTITAYDCNNVIESLHDLLLLAGWEEVEALFAYGRLYAPGALFVLRPLIYGSGVNGIEFINDNCDGPGFFGLSGGCSPDGSGDISGWYTGTFASLAAEISSTTPYGASVDLPFGFQLQAKDPGSLWNEPYWTTAPGVGFYDGPTQDIAGGGWKMRSQAANGRTQYEIEIRMKHVSGVLDLIVRELATGSTTERMLRTRRKIKTGYTMVENLLVGKDGSGPQIPRYKCMANPFQLVIYDEANEHDAGDLFNNGGNSFFCTAPYTENENLEYCLFVLGAGLLMDNTVWDTAASSVAINDNGFKTFQGSPFNAKPNTPGLAVRGYSFSSDLVTSTGRPIVQNAWLMAAERVSEEATILGKIWNAAAVSRCEKIGAEAMLAGRIMKQISRRTVGVNSSLWLQC